MSEDTRAFSGPLFVVSALAVILLSMFLFQMSYLFDNKYTVSREPASMGVMIVDAYNMLPFRYLVDGWEYYDGKLLTPTDVHAHTPDEYLYLGKYGGFDRGDGKKSPYGSATYRLTLFVENTTRRYALELPEIYSKWKLYINGELMAGRGEDGLPLSDNWMVTFQAKNTIEILVSVSNDSSLYSGMTYPPAFGTPKGVREVLTGRLVAHISAAAAALLIAVLCMLVGLGYRYTRPYHLLALLCLCLIGCISYPLIHAFGLSWDVWPEIERFCYYGMFLLMVLLQIRLCKIPRRISRPMIFISVCILFSILLQFLIPYEQAGGKYFYSDVLEYYKWLTALWLVGTCTWAVWKRSDYSRTLLLGSLVFASALAADRIHSLFEPIRFGWPVEMAGFMLILLIGGILWRDTVKVYKDSVCLEGELILAEEKERALMETNRMKSRFLSNVSHELQMPLTVVSGYAQLAQEELRDGSVDVAELSDYMRRIVREGDRMERMVAQLLDLTRIQTDCFNLRTASISVEELILQIRDIHFPMLNDNNNTLRLNTEPNMPIISCDGERILQVLINLISNACRHTHDGMITLSVRIKDGGITVSVSDTGEGMEPEITARLFERYLSNGTESGKAKGTGLGLYICKSIVSAHGGSISAVSRKGIGTVVSFTLPVNKDGEVKDGIVS